MAKKLRDQYIVDRPNLKVRGPVSPGPYECCAYNLLTQSRPLIIIFIHQYMVLKI